MYILMRELFLLICCFVHCFAYNLSATFSRHRTGSIAYPNSQIQRSTHISKATTNDRMSYETVAGMLHREIVPLSSGVSMEVLSQKPNKSSAHFLPPLVFIHGTYHAAWCWAEHWMPFFAGNGYETYSVSLRGTSGTMLPRDSKDKVKSVKVSEHVTDLLAFVSDVLPDKKPVLIGHSLGGIVVMKLLESVANQRHLFSGVALFCSVPPYGNGKMITRFMKERPLATLKTFIGFVFKLATKFDWLARDLFFCKDLPADDLKRYLKHFEKDSKVGLDLNDLNANLPIQNIGFNGKAKWLNSDLPVLVTGAKADFIVDERGVQDTASFLGVSHVMLPHVTHDVMLGPDYILGASVLLNWLEKQKI